MPPEPDSVTCSGLATTEPVKFRRPHESRWSEPVSWPLEAEQRAVRTDARRDRAGEVGLRADLSGRRRT